MVQGKTVTLEETAQRADLIYKARNKFVLDCDLVVDCNSIVRCSYWLNGHLSAAEALPVWQGGMSSNMNAVGLRQSNRFVHDREVSGKSYGH